jgi:ribonuclease HI
MQNSSAPKLIIYCDGRCKRYNDGPKGSWAFVVEDAEGSTEDENFGFCKSGPGVTNIVAEYQAVIEALRWVAANAQGRPVEVRTNLELIEQQVNGERKVKTAKLLPLRDEVRALLAETNATLRWIPKEQNKRADKLSRDAYRDVREREIAL